MQTSPNNKQLCNLTSKIKRVATYLYIGLTAIYPSYSLGTGIDSLPSHNCVAPDRPTNSIDVQLNLFIQNAGNSLVALAQHPTTSSIRYAVNLPGTINRINGCCSSALALDISSQVSNQGEGGLLGLALHPNFSSNGYAYIYYTTLATGSLTNRVSRFTTLDGGVTFSNSSEQIILDVPQFNPYHHGGDIHFGPDGYLYIGLGDGRTPSNAQDTNEMLGSILRIDVDGGTPYAIPAGNPFATGGGAAEIWAWGFRNPFRWGFDPATGELVAGDVGEDSEEELDLVEVGKNYGWPIYEGNQCFNGPCSTPNLESPIVSYSHTNGCAIIGGRTYRGSLISALNGAHIYGDFCSREIWAATPDGQGNYNQTMLAVAPGPLTGFSQDSDGEVFALVNNQAYRIEPNGGGSTNPFPQKLTETGCVDVNSPHLPAAGTIDYSVNSPLWSDGATKSRWVAMPNGEQVLVGDFNTDPNGTFVLPIGSVAVKTFFLQNTPVETRLMVRHDDGGWAGYTYEWDADGQDATLLPGAKTKTINGQQWTYPSRAQCLQCHTAAAGSTLGLETLQLNKDHTYLSTSRTANQLETWSHLGLLDTNLPPSVGDLPAIRDRTPDEEARGYLHANCSSCHRPAGGAGTNIDFRFHQSSNQMSLCDQIPNAGDLGIPDARNLKIDDLTKSILSVRMHLLGANQMPPLGRDIIDPTGTALIDDWILSWTSCTVGPNSDQDGIGDATDNCPNHQNPGQDNSVCLTICNDGIDNDGDGFTDYPQDPGCASLASEIEDPHCNDGIDNDGDGNIDGPLDIGCLGKSDSSELSEGVNIPTLSAGFFGLLILLLALFGLKSRAEY